MQQPSTVPTQSPSLSQGVVYTDCDVSLSLSWLYATAFAAQGVMSDMLQLQAVAFTVLHMHAAD